MITELKTGKQILTEILNSVANSPENIKSSADVKFDYARLQELKYTQIANGVKCTQVVFFPKQEGLDYQWFESNGIKLRRDKNKGLNYDYTNISKLVEDFDLRAKLDEKGFGEEDVLSVFDNSCFDSKTIYLALKTDINEFCEKSEKSFNENLIPKVSYIIKTSTLKFVFPYLDSQRMGRPAHDSTWIIKNPFIYGYTELVRGSYKGLEKTLNLFENVFGKMMRLNSILAEHKEDLDKLMKHWVSLNSRIEMESWSDKKPGFDPRHRLIDGRDLIHY